MLNSYLEDHYFNNFHGTIEIYRFETGLLFLHIFGTWHYE